MEAEESGASWKVEDETAAAKKEAPGEEKEGRAEEKEEPAGEKEEPAEEEEGPPVGVLEVFPDLCGEEE